MVSQFSFKCWLIRSKVAIDIRIYVLSLEQAFDPHSLYCRKRSCFIPGNKSKIVYRRLKSMLVVIATESRQTEASTCLISIVLYVEPYNLTYTAPVHLNVTAISSKIAQFNVKLRHVHSTLHCVRRNALCV